jgi:hypothetical protein
VLKTVTAVLASSAMVLAMGIGTAQTQASATPSVMKKVSVDEGKRSIIEGTVPSRLASRLVVLEAMGNKGKKRMEIGSGVSDSRGKVSVPVLLGGAGEYQARWRVLRNGRAEWTSAPFTLDVVQRGKPALSPRAGDVFQHAFPGAESVPQWGRAVRSGIGESLNYRDGEVSNAVGPVAKDATIEGAETATKTTGQMMGDLGTSFVTNVGWDFVADGVTSLYGLIFKGQGAATAQQVAQLTTDVQTGFATVEAQLDQVQASLTAVQQQLNTLQNEVVQANASAAASTCVTTLGQANSYVNEIQNYYGNYETVLDPQWVSGNLLGQSSQAGLSILGDSIYGSGVGSPSFGDGVTQLQTTVSALGRLLNTNGPVTSASLLGSCASAIAANIDAQYSASQNAQGLSQGNSIVPAGAVDQAYFDALQSITSYYTSWLAIGQSLSARGGQMGLAVLQGTKIKTVAQLNAMCTGQTPQSGSVLTCGGILANIEQSTQAFNAAWKSTGTSWFDVTNGLLVTDTKAGTASEFFTPAKRLWVQDIARFGEDCSASNSCVAHLPAAIGYKPTGPLSSLGAATTQPASMFPLGSIGVLQWLGFAFQPATTNAWQSLISTAGQTLPNGITTTSRVGSSTPGSLGTVGSLMNQAGLLNGGAAPSNLILYTGETGTFTPSADTNWFTQYPAQPSACAVQGVRGSGSTLTQTPAMTVVSFLDSNLSLLPGMNPVVAPPSGTGFYTNLGNVMNGAISTFEQIPNSNCSTQIGNSQPTVNSSFSLVGGPTANSGFYSPYTLNYGYTLRTFDCTGTGGATEECNADYDNYTQSVTANSSFMSPYSAVQRQYGWPVSPLTNGVPLGSSCTPTSFTQGVGGNAGITNVCANLYDDWMAGALGISQGPVSVSGGGYQGTLTTAGNNVFQALVTNTGQPQAVTLYAQGTNGAQVGAVLTAGSGGSGSVSNIACDEVTTTVLKCSLTVPSGTAVVEIPMLSSNGTVNVAVANAASASTSTTQVDAVPSSVIELPSAVQGLTAVAGNTNGTSITMQWSLPSTSLAVTGWQFALTSPSGATTTQPASGASPVTVISTPNSTNYTATLAVPSNSAGTAPTPPGIWSVSVAAVNPAGSGPAALATVGLGSSTPPVPTNFQASLNRDGTIKLTWNPVAASPPVSNYAIQITTPSTPTTPTQTYTVYSTTPAYTVQTVSQTGRYLFSLTAVSSFAPSQPATTTLNVTGIVPTAPVDIDLTVDADGWMNVAWLSSQGAPTVDSYQVALYQPGSTASSRPVTSIQVAAPIRTSGVRVPGIYQLAKDSAMGSWFVVITPSNALGVGEHGTSQMVVTAGVLARTTKAQQGLGTIDSAPAVALSRARAACSAGSWTIGYSAFGTCTNGVFTPIAIAG